eukprot:7606620-Alexandrium_andersonii.AAC.1
MPLAERLSLASRRRPSNQAKSSSHVMPSPGPVCCHWMPMRNLRSSPKTARPTRPPTGAANRQ